MGDARRSDPFPGGERAGFLIALAAALYGAWRVLRPLSVLFLFACALVSLAFPLFVRLRRRLGGRTRLAAVAVVAIVLGLVLTPAFALGLVLGQRLVAEVAAAAAAARSPGAVEAWTARLGPLRGPARAAGAAVARSLDEVSPALAREAAHWVAVVGRSLLQGGIAFFLVAVALYYLLRDGERWRDRLIRLLPLDPGDVRAFLRQFQRVSVGVFVGNLGTALAQGLAAALGYWLFGAPLPLLFALCTFVAALIPAVGTVLVWGPLALWLAVTGGWLRGLGLAAYGALVVGTIDNVVRPMLTRRGLQIHPLLVFFAVFGGVASYGAVGLFLGPLAVAIAVAFVDAWERRVGDTILP